MAAAFQPERGMIRSPSFRQNIRMSWRQPQQIKYCLIFSRID